MRARRGRCCSARGRRRRRSAAGRSAVLLCPTIAPEDVEAHRRRTGGAGLGRHRRADVGRPGAGPRRQHEPDGGLRGRGVRPPAARCSRRSSRKVFRVGTRPGDGARTKLVNNLLAGINLAGAAEAMAMAERLGLDLGAHAGRDRAVQRPELDRLATACAAPSPATTRHARTSRCCRRTPGWRWRRRRRAGFRGPLGPAAHDGVRARRAGRLTPTWTTPRC